jgi:hypothetical protein
MIKFLNLLFIIMFAFAFVERQILLMSRQTSDNTSLLQHSDSTTICRTKGAYCYESMINDGTCDAACSGISCRDADRDDCAN